MSRLLQHTRAAALRVLRQQHRQRRTWLAAATAAAVSAPGMPSATTPADAAGTALFGLVLAITITTIGAPGDDVASGAIAQDLLASSGTLAVVGGTALGAAVAAAPAAATVAALAARAPVLGNATVLPIAIAVVLLATAAALVTAVMLGTLIPGRTAAAITLPMAFVGFLPPQGLPVDEYPAAVASTVRAMWALLPLPHHLAPILRAVQESAPVPWGAVITLAGGAVAMLATSVAVLHWRIARGRWA